MSPWNLLDFSVKFVGFLREICLISQWNLFNSSLKFVGDDDDISVLQAKAYIWIYFNIVRVLSIQTNPYQALKNKQTNWNKENYKKESESDQTCATIFKIQNPWVFWLSLSCFGCCSRPSSGGRCRTRQKHPPRTGSSSQPQAVLWK